MKADASVSSIVSNLEAQIALRREKAAFHAQEEARHREQKEIHAAELEVLERNLAAFRSAAEAVVDLATRPDTATLPLQAPDPDPGRKPRLSRMVSLVIASLPAGQPFGTTAITREVSLRYRDRLRKPANPRMVSMHLRRLLAAGHLKSVSEGRPHHEALYARPE
ncbi:MAG TPA: hypothetical protein VF173_25360 [Thermoanaerobaculia bacterium]|nr:hypothetical protein [Thermoanaerobaculia bacterium]